jgi:hypothetical protein
MASTTKCCSRSTASKRWRARLEIHQRHCHGPAFVDKPDLFLSDSLGDHRVEEGRQAPLDHFDPLIHQPSNARGRSVRAGNADCKGQGRQDQASWPGEPLRRCSSRARESTQTRLYCQHL